MHQAPDGPICCSEQNGRDNNEDSLLVCPFVLPDHSPAMLCLLADGMGGHAHGEHFSRAALLRLSSLMLEQLCLKPALNATQPPPPLPTEMPTQIWQMLQLTQNHLARLMQTNHWTEGGTTLAGCLVTVYGAWAFNLGDSPIFHCRPELGSLTLCSHDHSVAGVMLAQGEISPEMARYHEGRHRLAYYLGNKPLPPHPAVQPLALQPGDILMLCSDGVSNTLQVNELQDWLCQAEDLETCARQLLQTGRAREETDNQSLILWRIPEAYRPGAPPVQVLQPALSTATPEARPAAPGHIAPAAVFEAVPDSVAAPPADGYVEAPDSPLALDDPLLELSFGRVSQSPDAAVYLLTMPVTRALWQRFCSQTAEAPPDEQNLLPVTGKTLAQISAWIDALNQQAAPGRVYRLPTETEWLQPWRDDPEAEAAIGPETAWCEAPDPQPRPVAGKAAVAGRFYDLAGNVWEWVRPADGSAEALLKGGAAHLPRADCAPQHSIPFEQAHLAMTGFRLSVVQQRGKGTC
ncbi:MAG: protein phosphatase 2C domain-containing protein [Candidatus Sericytochromatia bacterium]|nr:protein phosphatase 2C domain-containing protein [Candidatus Sericytochromatia bacterium]